MKPVKFDRYICGNCDKEEDVLEGGKPTGIKIIVAGNDHLWCPDCVYNVKSWRKHVNIDHLSRPPKQEKEAIQTDKSTTQHVNALSGAVRDLRKSKIQVLNPDDEDIFTVPPF